MRPTEIKELTGHSTSTIWNAKNGKLKNKELEFKIIELLNLEKSYLEDLFMSDLFVEMCEIAIAKTPSKGKGIEIRKFAVLCQHQAMALRNRKSEGDNK